MINIKECRKVNGIDNRDNWWDIKKEYKKLECRLLENGEL